MLVGWSVMTTRAHVILVMPTSQDPGEALSDEEFDRTAALVVG